jgi:hypothetical protein
MACGQAADAVQRPDQLGRTQPTTDLVLWVSVDGFVHTRDDLLKAIHVGYGDETCTANRNGFQVL